MKHLNYMRRIGLPIAMMTLLTVACSGTTPSSQDGGEGEAQELAEGQAGENAIDQVEIPQREPEEVKISGTITGGANKPVYLQIVQSQDVKPLDTITAGPNGEYSFTHTDNVPRFYRIGVDQNNSFYLILHPGESAVANADVTNMFKSFEVVEGPEECHRMKEMNSITGQKDSINMILQASQMNKDQDMFQDALIAYDNINVRVERQIKSYINKKPASLSSLAALQNLNPDTDFQYYDMVIKALDGIANGNDIYDNMRSQVISLRKVAVGVEAPDFTLQQPNGEMLSLSDLRGQYVLIDFWASWCGPCRRENPNVKKVYDKYHEKGFEILGVSLDKNQQAWLNAIGQDELNWRHVSDLKYWQSSVVPLYNITGIPMTVLVDKNGIIVGKNLRGESLEIKLAQIFGE